MINLSVVIGQQPVAVSLDVDITHPGFGSQFRCTDRARTVTFYLVFTGVSLNPPAVRIYAIYPSAICSIPVRCPQLLIAGTGDSGALRAVAIEVVVLFAATRPGVTTPVAAIVITTTVVTSTVMAVVSVAAITVICVPVASVAIVHGPVSVPVSISARPPTAVMVMIPIVIAVPVTTGVIGHVEGSPAPA